jgi:hypothetical protein
MQFEDSGSEKDALCVSQAPIQIDDNSHVGTSFVAGAAANVRAAFAIERTLRTGRSAAFSKSEVAVTT